MTFFKPKGKAYFAFSFSNQSISYSSYDQLIPTIPSLNILASASIKLSSVTA